MLLQNRARLGFGRDRTFVPTPNVRNPHMLQEAEAFSHHLRDFEHAVREYHRRVQGEHSASAAGTVFILSKLVLAATAVHTISTGTQLCSSTPGPLVPEPGLEPLPQACCCTVACRWIL